MEGPALKPSTPTEVIGREPAFELWIAFLFSIVPHVAGLFAGGYGQVITNAPIAVVVTIVDVVGLVIAYLQFREDSHGGRSSHWLVWATIAIGAIWFLYALLVGAVVLFGNAFCVSQNCRAPLT